MQSMGLAGEIAARTAGTALVQVNLILATDRFGALHDPGFQAGRVLRQVGRQRSGGLELRTQVLRSAVA